MIDKEDISEKNLTLTMILALFYGSFGLHRFYVGKIKSGLIYLFFGGTGAVLITFTKLRVFDSVNFTLFYVFTYALVYVAIIYDIFALYTESFSDSKGKILLPTSKIDETVGRTLDEKFNNKIEIALALLLAIIAIIFLAVIGSINL